MATEAGAGAVVAVSGSVSELGAEPEAAVQTWTGATAETGSGAGTVAEAGTGTETAAGARAGSEITAEIVPGAEAGARAEENAGAAAVEAKGGSVTKIMAKDIAGAVAEAAAMAGLTADTGSGLETGTEVLDRDQHECHLRRRSFSEVPGSGLVSEFVGGGRSELVG